MDATQGYPKQGKYEMQIHGVYSTTARLLLDGLLFSGRACWLRLEGRLCRLSQRASALALS